MLTRILTTYDRGLFFKGYLLLHRLLNFPERILSVNLYFYQGIMTPARPSREGSDPFIFFNGTKQSLVHATYKFALYFSVILETTFENVKEIEKFEFRTSGGLFNQKRFKARTNNYINCSWSAHCREFRPFS